MFLNAKAKRLLLLILLPLGLSKNTPAQGLLDAADKSGACVLALLQSSSSEALVQWSLASFEAWQRRYPAVVARFVQLYSKSDAFKQWYERSYPDGAYLTAFLTDARPASKTR